MIRYGWVTCTPLRALPRLEVEISGAKAKGLLYCFRITMTFSSPFRRHRLQAGPELIGPKVLGMRNPAYRVRELQQSGVNSE
jgi:hypothetical protein